MTKYDVSKVIIIAKSQVGYAETPENITKYSAYFEGTDFYNGSKGNGTSWGVAWCDIFFDYCMCQAFGMENARKIICQPKNSYGAGCRESYRYYKQAKRTGTTPKIGAQIFFSNDGTEDGINHTGIVIKIEGNKVYTIEGNKNNKVSECSYSKSNKTIYGYGYPKYDEIASESAPAPVVPSESNSSSSIEEMATRTYRGEFGNMPGRKAKIEALGYSYEEVQAKLNEMYYSKKPTDDSWNGFVNTVRDPLNVRQSSNLTSPVIKQLAKGSTHKFRGAAKNGMYQLADGSGWCAASLVKKL